jgi:hypothetical protein
MKIIKKYVERIEEEIEDAQHYAERFVECKAKGHMSDANTYAEMANDELKHATYIHRMAVQAIEEIAKVYQPPEEMMEKWEKAHRCYVEKVAWIKQMLAM